MVGPDGDGWAGWQAVPSMYRGGLLGRIQRMTGQIGNKGKHQKIWLEDFIVKAETVLCFLCVGKSPVMCGQSWPMGLQRARKCQKLK